MAASSVPLHVSSLVEMLFGLEMLLRVMSLLTKLDILTAGRQERGTARVLASGLKLLACSGNYGQHVQTNTCTLTNKQVRGVKKKNFTQTNSFDSLRDQNTVQDKANCHCSMFLYL